MYDPYIGFYPARETSVKNRSGLERHSIFTQAPLPPMPMIPLSPGGLTPGQALTDFLGLPGTTPAPPHIHGVPMPLSPEAPKIPGTGSDSSEFPQPPTNQSVPPTDSGKMQGYTKAWQVSPSVHAVYPDETEAQTSLTGLNPVVTPNPPQFAVPTNPILPSEYHEVISYEGLQYLNGFLRTQIGKFCFIEFLFGSSGLATRYGVLVGVGINYILLENPSSHELTVADFYSIRYVEIISTEAFRSILQACE